MAPDRLTIVEYGIDNGYLSAEEVKNKYKKQYQKAEQELKEAAENLAWIEAKMEANR
jgi:hypothetical protein